MTRSAIGATSATNAQTPIVDLGERPGLVWTVGTVAGVLSLGYGILTPLLPAIGALRVSAAIVTVLMGAAAAAWLARDRVLLVSLLAFSFVLSRFIFDTGAWVLEPWHVAVMLCFSGWALEVLRRRNRRVRLDAVGWCALLVVVAAGLSVYGAFDMATWLKRTLRIVLLFTVYLYLLEHVRTRREIAALIRASLAGCAVAVLAIFSQVRDFLQENPELHPLDYSLAGTFRNANEGATYLAMFVVMAVATYSLGVHRQVLGRGLFILATALAVVGIVLTRSRTGLVAIVLTILLLFIRSKHVRRALFFAALLVVLTWNSPVTQLFVVGRFLPSFGVSTGDQDYDAFVTSSTVDREYLWTIYWEAIKARPVFGIGAANYAFMNQLNLDLPVLPEGASGEQSIPTGTYVGQSSHNGFLNWWAETGTVGLIPFVGSLGVAALGLRRLLRRRPPPDPWLRATALGTGGALIVFVLTNLTGDFGVSEARYWLVLAFTSIVLRQSKESERAWSESPTSRTPAISAGPTTA